MTCTGETSIESINGVINYLIYSLVVVSAITSGCILYLRKKNKE